MCIRDRYYKWATLLLPTFGENFLQVALIHMQTNNFGRATYNLMRAILTKTPSSAAFSNFKALISDPHEMIHKRMLTAIKEIHIQELKNIKIVNTEIIEYYFLGLFSYHFNQQQNSKLENGIGIKHLESVFYERVSTRFIKNLDLIMEDLAIVIGGFTILLKLENNTNTNKLGNKKSEVLSKSQKSYLSFAFKFITHILKDVIKDSWKANQDAYQYLTMVRLIGWWLNSNEVALEYSRNNEHFCFTFGRLLNDILKEDYKFEDEEESSVVRSYLFEDEVQFKDFACVDEGMFNFDMPDIRTKDDINKRLMGIAPESELLTKNEEIEWKLHNIVIMGRKILTGNKFGIEWDTETFKYTFTTRERIAKAENTPVHQKSRRGILPNIIGKKKVSVQEKQKQKTTVEAQTQLSGKTIIGEEDTDEDLEPLSVTELEAQLRNEQNSNNMMNWGYSGSSIPDAPSHFDVKPSNILTQPNDTLRLSSAFSNPVFNPSERTNSPNPTPSESSLQLKNLEESLRNLNAQGTDNNTTTTSYGSMFQQPPNGMHTSLPTSAHSLYNTSTYSYVEPTQLQYFPNQYQQRPQSGNSYLPPAPQQFQGYPWGMGVPAPPGLVPQQPVTGPTRQQDPTKQGSMYAQQYPYNHPEYLSH